MSQSAEDLERQGVTASSQSREQYGATPAPDVNKEELLFGRFPVSPSKLVHILVCIYAFIFTVMTAADIWYYNSVDGRFPEGMEHMYPSEAERKATKSYTRQNILVFRLHGICVFISVMCFVHFQVFKKADIWLCTTTTYLKEKWQYYWDESCVCLPFRNLWGVIVQIFFCILTPFQWCFGKCVTCQEWFLGPLQRLFSEHKWRDLLHGSVYLALFATFFFLISIPFQYQKFWIDMDFGFTNALTVTEAGFQETLVAEFFYKLVGGIPMTFLFLAVLQFRFGWLFMWVGLIGAMIWAQFNMALLGPLALDMNNVFPTGVFGAGRGFPIQSTGINERPWISLNRIIFPSAQLLPQYGQNQYTTNDKHKGQLVVGFDKSANSWKIAGRNSGKAYAVTDGGPAENLESLSGKAWKSTDGKSVGQLGARSGAVLRDKLNALAEKQDVHIQEIYMVDGSHADARANAFVGGMNGSIIGLYDTLFLGDHPKNYQTGDAYNGFFALLNWESGLRSLSLKLQSVDVSDEDNQELWSSAPTQAMMDDEIVAILAHELAHVSHNHMEKGLVIQAATQLVTFAALGWAAHSSLLGVGLGLSAPLLWVGACAYEHLIGPPLDTILKFFTDWNTRVGEYEADGYVAGVSLHYANALQNSLAKLAVNANQDPDYPYWYESLHDDHPTVAHRWAHIETIKKEKYGK